MILSCYIVKRFWVPYDEKNGKKVGAVIIERRQLLEERILIIIPIRHQAAVATITIIPKFGVSSVKEATPTSLSKKNY